MKNIILALLIPVLLTGCLPTANIDNTNRVNTNENELSDQGTPQEKKDENIVCAEDVKHCPQGFYLSRTPPDCDFPACPEMEKSQELVKPIAEFETRITKKPFGIYITPKTSPVEPEKFTGYHTGADIEYDDLPNEKILVYAIDEGQVVRSDHVSGYGGMIAIKHKIKNTDYIVIYGHLSPESLPALNSSVYAGQNIGYLGQGYSLETDNERKHLHLAIYTGSDINVRGYVNTKDELAKWLDPIEFFK